MKNGIVKALFLRLHHGKSVTSVNNLSLLAERGIKGDVNCSILSPRHVLLVSEDILNNFSLNAGSLRENITISNFDIDTLESGNIIQIGEVLLQISFENEKCNVVQPEIKKKRGIYATALTGGNINIGDIIKVISNQTASLKNKKNELFLQFISQVPEGRIVTYNQVIEAIGGTKAHLRIIPTFIKKAINNENDYPVHRIVNSRGELIKKYILNQRKLLESENVEVSKLGVNVTNYSWQPTKNLYNIEL